MPSHLRVPELTGDLPATVSGAALTGLLRGELGFTGVIVSDALEMRATRDMFGIPRAAVPPAGPLTPPSPGTPSPSWSRRVRARPPRRRATRLAASSSRAPSSVPPRTAATSAWRTAR